VSECGKISSRGVENGGGLSHYAETIQPRV
jgi:hypothetical protein